MNTTTIRVLVARLVVALQSVDWVAVGRRCLEGLSLCWAVAQLLFLLGAVVADYIWQHRQQIRSAVVHAIAWLIVAAELTHHAGRWTRRQLEALMDRSAALLPQQPVPPLAPITASLAAVREALERLVRRLYPVLA